MLPNIPGREEFLARLRPVIHDVMIQDIGDTLNLTIYIIGIIIIITATVQIVTNSVLLLGAVTQNKKIIPNRVMTRVFYLSTFWGTIDAYRKKLNHDVMTVILV